MLVRRLQWAGILLESKQIRILIDPVYKSPDTSFFGEPRQTFSALEDIKDTDVILITHLHSDHFDPAYILSNYGSSVQLLVPKGTEDTVKENGFHNVKGISIGETFKLKDATITGSYSIDGLGDNQISWIIKDEDRTVIHCGDTLWHGYWWKMAKEYGPFDVAFLPINGAVVCEEGMVNSNQPICLNPEQAVSAAKVLEAKLLIPIHYGSFHNPPIYLETENVEKRVITATKKENLSVKLLKPLEEFVL